MAVEEDRRLRKKHSISKTKGFTLIETMISLAVLMIVMGSAIEVVARIMMASRVADTHMLISTENQRAMREMKNDLTCSSKNTVGPYAPVIVGDELRFRVVTDFDADEGCSVFSGYQLCFWLDTSSNLLFRRFRDATGTILDEAPAEFPGAAAQVIGQYVTGVSYSINADAGMVTITLTTSMGEVTDNDDYTQQFSVIPYNSD